MKKRCFALLACLFLLVKLSLLSFASQNTETVYGLPGEQEKVMSLFEQGPDNDSFSKNHFSLKKESIMPVYVFDWFDYARKGVSQIERVENHYVADFFLEDGRFGGVVHLEINEDYAEWSILEASRFLQEKLNQEPIGDCPCQCSYSEHQGFIRSYLGKDVKEEDVRYVSISMKGLGFYVKGTEERPDALIFLGNEKNCDNESRIVWVDEKLKTQAEKDLQAYEKKLAEIETWKQEHPGEDYPFDGGLLPLNAETPDDKKGSLLIPVIAGTLLAGTGILGGTLLIAKKRKRTI